MPGIYTWERDLSKGPLMNRFKGPWFVAQGQPSLIEQNVKLRQLTTSYRSGGGESFSTDISAKTNREIANSAILEAQKFRTPYDNGHEFETISHEILFSHPHAVVYGGQESYYGVNSFRGPLSTSKYGSYDDFFLPIDLDYTSIGTGLISETIPTKSMSDPIGDLAQILFGQFSPSHFGSTIFGLYDRVDLARSAGSEYLNLVFGWGPTIRDVADIMKAVKDSVKIVSNFYRDSGKNVRRTRERHLPSSYKVLSTFGSQGRPFNYLDERSVRPLYDPYGGSNALITESVSEIHNLRFTANYTYYVPFDDTILGELERYESLSNKVLNHRLTPDLLWQLAPWTWLADWFANIGDIISNASALMSDGLVIRYAYLQDESFVDHTYSVSGVRFAKWDPGVVDTIYRTKRKKRVRSSPYGFGLNTDSFTEQQWAILGALGMSKAPKKLH